MDPKIKASKLLERHESLESVLLDKDLAGLGDTYVNFVYSLMLSCRLERPTGAKVNNRILAEAVKRSGLRRMLPRRVDRHDRGNAAEALIVYAWLTGTVSFEDCIEILGQSDDITEAFARLLREIEKRLGVAHE
ncbi:MAG: hypothetical protein JSV29_04645 [Candidatus Bathyarchaeota archaeon]|nr:MAG: hypothetical protein JSV29_04645 [Candidatus Bathyarchaeota archaeon]